jgi:hypothetical protein
MPRRHDGAGSVVLAYGLPLADQDQVLDRLRTLLRALRRDWLDQSPDMTKAHAPGAEVSSNGPDVSLAPEPGLAGVLAFACSARSLDRHHRRSALNGTQESGQ